MATAAPSSERRNSTGWGWTMAYGIGSILIAIIAFFWPISATIAATLVFGAMVFAAGILSLVSAVKHARHRAYNILFGLLSVLVGVFTWFWPVAGAISLTMVIIFWLAMRGVFEIIFGFRAKRLRALLISLGVLNLVLAFLVFWTMPLSALTLPGVLLAVSFLFGGIAAIGMALDQKRGDDERTAA